MTDEHGLLVTTSRSNITVHTVKAVLRDFHNYRRYLKLLPLQALLV